jgi:hypothetical protein
LSTVSETSANIPVAAIKMEIRAKPEKMRATEPLAQLLRLPGIGQFHEYRVGKMTPVVFAIRRPVEP